VVCSLLSLRRCIRGNHDLLSFRPSSLLILLGCSSISLAFLISLSMYFDLVESSLVSCSLMVWSWLMLCSATADFWLGQPYVSAVFLNALLHRAAALSNVDSVLYW
jgi:uncharacterized membrane protein